MTQYETTEAQENGICGKENGGGRGIDGFWLKMLAVVTMLIDHIGAIFFPGVLWIRAIGRLSFPIYLIHRYSTFPASTSFIIAKNPGRSKQVPLMPSSVKWTMFVKPCCAANSSNIAF